MSELLIYLIPPAQIVALVILGLIFRVDRGPKGGA